MERQQKEKTKEQSYNERVKMDKSKTYKRKREIQQGRNKLIQQQGRKYRVKERDT